MNLRSRDPRCWVINRGGVEWGEDKGACPYRGHRALDQQWPSVGGIAFLTVEQVWDARMIQSSQFAADE